MNRGHRLARRRLRRTWRRRLFFAWISSSIVVAAVGMIGGPVTSYLTSGGEPTAVNAVALTTPALMGFMLITGFLWLTLYVASEAREVVRRR